VGALSIVRTDFPSARRGWDPDAVRAHLEEVDALLRSLREQADRAAAPVSTADAASAQVREIVAAAERSAAAIREDAERDAAGTRAAAAAEAETARAVVGMVAERARELERSLDELASMLRGEAGAGEGRADAAAEPAPPAPQTAPAAPQPARAAEPAADRGDEEAARLVALDLALSGRSRAEVDRHLADHYDIADRNSLLDDVFFTIEG
jgi:hypothetical protein